jgi:hypothetical protein
MAGEVESGKDKCQSRVERGNGKGRSGRSQRLDVRWQMSEVQAGTRFVSFDFVATPSVRSSWRSWRAWRFHSCPFRVFRSWRAPPPPFAISTIHLASWRSLRSLCHSERSEESSVTQGQAWRLGGSAASRKSQIPNPKSQTNLGNRKGPNRDRDVPPTGLGLGALGELGGFSFRPVGKTWDSPRCVKEKRERGNGQVGRGTPRAMSFRAESRNLSVTANCKPTPSRPDADGRVFCLGTANSRHWRGLPATVVVGSYFLRGCGRRDCR